METYIVNDVLHVTLSQDEANALLGATMPGAGPVNRTAQGQKVHEALREEIRQRVARTGWEPVLRFTVEAAPARPGLDPLHVQRERWAQQAAATTPFPLDTCRLVADFAEDQSQADGILEMAGLSGRSPQSIMKALKERREA